MIPKRSWATLVPGVVYENLRDAPDSHTIEIAVIDWKGNSPTPGDTVYLIKPKSNDKYKDAGIFCAAILVKQDFGFANLRFEKQEILTRKDSSYIRFDSLNLKDNYLRRIQANTSNCYSR